jgi:hypothetical protein
MSESSLPAHAAKKPLLSDKTYTTLKHGAAIILPALSALYFTLAQVWHFPDTAQVMATIAAVNTAVGALMGVSSLSYNSSDAKYAGNLIRTETPDTINYTLALNHDAPGLDKMQEATFKVTHTAPAPYQGE